MRQVFLWTASLSIHSFKNYVSNFWSTGGPRYSRVWYLQFALWHQIWYSRIFTSIICGFANLLSKNIIFPQLFTYFFMIISCKGFNKQIFTAALDFNLKKINQFLKKTSVNTSVYMSFPIFLQKSGTEPRFSGHNWTYYSGYFLGT